MAMPYRYQEILQVLNDSPSGLITRQVMTECRKKPGSEIPNDNGVVSKCLYALRQTKLISTSDAVGGSVHKITGKGQVALHNETNSEQKQEIEVTEEKATNTTKEPIALGLTLDPSDAVESAFIEIVTAIREAQKPVVIERKQHKIDTLNRLGALMSDDIKAIFSEIASDIETLTA